MNSYYNLYDPNSTDEKILDKIRKERKRGRSGKIIVDKEGNPLQGGKKKREGYVCRNHKKKGNKRGRYGK